MVPMERRCVSAFRQRNLGEIHGFGRSGFRRCGLGHLDRPVGGGAGTPVLQASTSFLVRVFVSASELRLPFVRGRWSARLRLCTTAASVGFNAGESNTWVDVFMLATSRTTPRSSS